MEPLHQTVEGYESSPEQARIVQLAGSRALQAELRLRVPAGTSLASLERALGAVAERHEILRTRLVTLPGVGLPVQRIEPATRLRPELNHTQLRLSCDAWLLDEAGMLQLAAEWAAEYAGETASEVPLQYADYAAWRNQQLLDDAAAGMFWRRVQVQWQSAARLPFRGLVHSPSPSFARAALALPLAAARFEGLSALAAEHALEPADLVLAAWMILLARHAGQERLGLALDWQARPEFVRGALGAFFEPLPLMAAVPADRALLELARELREQRLELLEHREFYPHARQPLAAGYGFRFLPSPPAALARAGWALEELAPPIAWQPLALECCGSQLRIEFDPQTYRGDAIALLGDQLDCLLADLASDPHRPHAELRALSEAERASVRTFAEAAPLSEVADAVYRSVAGAPNLRSVLRPDPSASTAVASSTQHVSYAELSARSLELARRLRACGVTPGAAVGHRVRRDVDAVVAMLAIFEVGAVYLPIDPSAPSERSGDVLSRAGARWVVTDPELRILELAQPLAAEPDPDVAYVIFTSGSTGRPKGVPITHRAALHSLAARLAYYPGVVQRFLLVSSFAFDSSIAGLFATLAQGGMLFIASEEEARDPAALARIVERERITHLLALPSLHQLLLAELGGGPCSLQSVIVAGEACTPELIALHAARLPNARLYNEYGPTEAAVWSTVADLNAHDPRLPVPIGRPIPHARLQLLDAAGTPVPRGVPGELYVGGPGLSPGYLGEPALSAARFVEREGERLYRTGDRAFWNEHGELVFAGRNDDQLKLRGHRIELAEIEAVLERVSGAARVVVLADARGAGEPKLRAFLEQDSPLDREALARSLATWLPAPMIPSELEALPELPRTASGKLDRLALLARPSVSPRAGYVPPQGPLETALARHFAELLGAPRVGRHDDFFSLGGHSLLVVRLVHRLRAEQGLTVRVGSVFEHPTVARLAAALAEPERASPPVLLREGQSAVPLFCLHDSHGDVHAYAPLLARLPAGKRVYGLPLSATPATERGSIASLARAHLAEIRRLCPGGPYELCGYSIGGVIAFEIAALLERGGETVRFLGLFDSTWQAGIERLDWPELARAVATELTAEAAARFRQLPAAELEALQHATAQRGVVAQLRYALLDWAPQRELALRAPREILAEHLSGMDNARRWLAGYAPSRLQADVDLFAAEATLAEAPSLPDAWCARTRGRLHLERVPGDHDALLSSPRLAERLARVLGRVNA